MALPVLNNPSLLTCLKKPLLVENTFLAANVTGSLLKCPTTGKEQCRWESGAQPELMQLGESSSSPDRGGQLASQEESQALDDRSLADRHCLDEVVFPPSAIV